MSTIPVREGHDWRQPTAPTCGNPCVSGTRDRSPADLPSDHIKDLPVHRRVRPSRVSCHDAVDGLYFHRTDMTMLEVDICDNCGTKLEGEAHFSIGKTWCRECWAGRAPAKAMPPSPQGQRQIAAWLQPRTSTPAAQQTLRLGPATQPQGAPNGR